MIFLSRNFLIVEVQAISQISSDKSSDKNEFQAINELSSDKSNQKQEDVEKELLSILQDKQEHSVPELANRQQVVDDLVKNNR